MSSKQLLDENEVFMRVGNSVETVGKAESISYDRQEMTGEDDSVPVLVFVGEETYRDRMGDPGSAVSIEVMGRDRWTIGFLDRTTDKYISLIDVDSVDSFFRMIEEVEALKMGFSFPDSPEATDCTDCRGKDHLNHVIDIDAEAGRAFIDGIEDIVGQEIHV